MKINTHSITFTTLFYLITFSVIFVIFISISIKNFFSASYMDLEQEKIILIQKNISHLLALNISNGFEKSIKDVVKQTLENENVLLIKIKEDKSSEEMTFSNNTLSIDDYIKNKDFISNTVLLDPISSQRIAEMIMVYSHNSYNEYMKQLYNWLLLGGIGLVVSIILLVYILLKSLKRLTTLAISLNNFNPDNPQKLTIETSANDEISSIITSANVMVDNLIKYLNHTKELNKQLSKNQGHLKDAQRIAKVGSWEYNVSEDILTVSDEVYRILGMKTVTLSWEDSLSFISQNDKEYVVSVFNNAIKNGSYFDINYSIKTKDKMSIYIHTIGKVRKKADGTIKMTAVSMDITQETKNKQIIEKLAYYDSLTKLPNRSLLKDRIHKAIQNASRQNTKIAVMFLDLDHFKLINDTLGHSVGDKLLIYISGLLKQQIRESDTIARIGGDEFVIILPNIKSVKDVEIVANNLINILRGQHSIDKHNLYITTSIGISLFPDNSSNMDELITNADTAMYDAKQDGRNKYKIYEKAMGHYISRQMKIEQDLKNAVNHKNEIEVYYQPKIDTAKNFVVGAEALIRWNHPKNGLMFPDEFIEVAESTGIILELGRWVIEECISQVKEWNSAGFTELIIAINLSARQFQDNELVPFIASMIKKYSVNPDQLEFEVTETISMSNIDATLKILNELKNIGVSIAIDDFGTGYSSLSYLKKFPINTLKIDKSFVIDMNTDEGDKVIVETIISMAHTLGFITVAEGVETKEHKDLLGKLECDQLQGYYFSRAITKNEFTNFLLEYNQKI